MVSAVCFEHRIRQTLTWASMEPCEVWCARPEDVIFGKLLAWDEVLSNTRRIVEAAQRLLRA